MGLFKVQGTGRSALKTSSPRWSCGSRGNGIELHLPVLPCSICFLFLGSFSLPPPWLAAWRSSEGEPRVCSEDVFVWMNTLSTYKSNKGKRLH